MNFVKNNNTKFLIPMRLLHKVFSLFLFYTSRFKIKPTSTITVTRIHASVGGTAIILITGTDGNLCNIRLNIKPKNPTTAAETSSPSSITTFTLITGPNGKIHFSRTNGCLKRIHPENSSSSLQQQN
ncbi:uncharacterized protein LOC117168517 [Belonocnema kinseyi]|uniref:uncharacterized protein LOC117168517 n=1 Tax=Belonocnema kinseyi TaxID=2817044 RepID=UPI00143DA58E|nr:uncharacterized protein LOC117168517 [Belonocnema kinseyi]